MNKLLVGMLIGIALAFSCLNLFHFDSKTDKMQMIVYKTCDIHYHPNGSYCN